MASQAEPVEAHAAADDETTVPQITAHETTPERLVFTEVGNTDGWIATDVTVALDNFR